MPEYDRIGPYVIAFYAVDRAEPIHVHVRRDRQRVKVWLGEEPGAASATVNRGFSPREVRRIVRLIETEREGIIRFWNETFRES